jgi:hypothetical protein
VAQTAITTLQGRRDSSLKGDVANLDTSARVAWKPPNEPVNSSLRIGLKLADKFWRSLHRGLEPMSSEHAELKLP